MSKGDAYRIYTLKFLFVYKYSDKRFFVNDKYITDNNQSSI